jgi:hypothetical protein
MTPEQRKNIREKLKRAYIDETFKNEEKQRCLLEILFSLGILDEHRQPTISNDILCMKQVKELILKQRKYFITQIRKKQGFMDKKNLAIIDNILENAVRLYLTKFHNSRWCVISHYDGSLYEPINYKSHYERVRRELEEKN